MRITGGILRGRRILVPKLDIRPTQEKVREALFSILGSIRFSLSDSLYQISYIRFSVSDSLKSDSLYRIYRKCCQSKSKYIERNIYYIKESINI